MPSHATVVPLAPEPRRLRAALGALATIALVAVSAGLGLGAAPASAATAEIDQASSDAQTGWFLSAGESRVQSFTAGRSGALTAVDLQTRYASGDAPVDVAIVTLSGGQATSTVLASTSAVLTTAEGWQTVTFPEPASVTAGTQYGIRLTRTGPDVDLAAGSYPDGAWLWDGWYSSDGSDIAFRTYVAPVAPTVTGPTSLTGVVGHPLSAAYTVTGAPVPTLAVSGSVPPGLSLGQDGVLSGTPSTAGTSTFTVVASNAAGSASGAATTITVRDPLPPTAPVAPKVVAGAQSATVSWQAPTESDSPVTGYTVTASPGGRTCTTTTTSCTVTGLDAGTPYTFVVTASSEVGTSSGSASTAAVAPFTVPSQPVGLSAVPGAGQVELTWAAPTGDGGSALTAYDVERADDLGRWQLVTSVDATTTSALDVGRENGTAVTYRVRAVNAAGAGAWAVSGSVVPVGVPTAPGDLRATPGDGTVSLRWADPADDGGSAVESFAVEYREDGAADWTDREDVSGRSDVVGGLTNGVRYEFRVSARNAAGSSDWSAEAAATPRTVPGAPSGVVADPGAGSATVHWDAPASDGGAAVSGYTVQTRSGDEPWVGARTVDGDTASATVTGLENGVPLSVRVVATNAAGDGAASAAVTVTPRTTPGTPRDLTAVPAAGSAALRWSPPASDGGSVITEYDVQWRAVGTDVWTDAMATTAPDTTVIGLENGTGYEFRVRAVSLGGAGEWSTTTASASTTPFVLTIAATSAGHTLAGATLRAGAEVSVSASDLPVGALATVIVHSDPVTLGTARVAEDGTLSFTGTLPSDLAAGPHEVIVRLTDTGADAVTDSVPFTVEAAAVVPPSTGPTPPATGPTPPTTPAPGPSATGGTVAPAATGSPAPADAGGRLAFTGSAVPVWLLPAALTTVLLGLVLSVVRRNRRSRP